MRRQTPSTIGPCRVTIASNAVSSRRSRYRSRSCHSDSPEIDPPSEDAAELGDRQPL